MLFADYIILIDETRVDVNTKLELWQQRLESKNFRISRSKTEYMECKLSTDRNTNQSVILDGSVIPMDDCFLYLRSIIQKDRKLDSDVAHRVRAGWLKWKDVTGILCDRNIPLYLKKKFYRTAVRLFRMLGS
jgi:hypothetical protein